MLKKLRFIGSIQNIKLNRKIQLTFFLLIVPLFILFLLLFFNMYKTNQQYDQIIANASEAGRFSIKFKEEFDYKVYVLVAYGQSDALSEQIYGDIYEGREIALDLINNTNINENKWRAERILKFLDNLEEYVKRIENNKAVGGYYDENYSIWENDIQIVTSLIQATVLEYTYYETKGMEEVRLAMAENLNRISGYSFVVFAILTFVALILSVVIPNSIVKPIHHLNDVTNQVAQGDFKVRAKDLNGAEVKKLGRSLNSMIEKIEQLLIAVKKDERNLREAELELLQSQINPHFLYNTLDTIIWLAESGKQAEVVEMVTSLSGFFRTSLNHGNGMFTLSEEERHVRSYLEIQQVRYQDILTYEIDFPDFLKDVIIPKITLQPIVENALYHGIKNRRGKGKIVVKAEIKEEDIIISVIDNGIGMHPERLQQINQGLGKKDKNMHKFQKKESYGLYNVNERIKLKFGDNYGLTIKSEYGRGTCVEVKIPF